MTRKITYGLACVAVGKQQTIYLGNLDAKRDWGFAPDYVAGMWAMLQEEKPADYVLATGRAETIRNFASGAAAAFGFDLEWTGEGNQSRGIDRRSGRTFIAVDPAFYRPSGVDFLVGDSSKAKAVLGWEAKTTRDDGQGRLRPGEERRCSILRQG